MLRALSKVLNEKNDGNDAYCITNTSRLLLCVGLKGGKGNRRTYLYVEALRKYSEDIAKADLVEAYRKAKPMYDGRLERTFVVLKEESDLNGVRPYPLSGSNQEPVGSKRLLPDQAGGSSKRPALG